MAVLVNKSILIIFDFFDAPTFTGTLGLLDDAIGELGALMEIQVKINGRIEVFCFSYTVRQVS